MIELNELKGFSLSASAVALEEFSTLRLGDARLDRRLRTIFQSMMNNPGKSIPEQSGGWAEATAFYRLLDHESLSAESVLGAHAQSSLRRASDSGERTILAIQDTTSLNFTERKELDGLGSLSDKGEGLYVHSTMIMGANSGNIYGLLGSKIFARIKIKRSTQSASICNRLPIEQKESYRWLESFNDSVQEVSNPRNLHLVHVADREADIYELLLAAQAHRKDGMDLLVRSKHNRGQSEKQDRIWDSLSASPERGKMLVSLPRSRGLQKEEIEVSVRYEQYNLSPPVDKVKYQEITESVQATLIEVRGGTTERPILWRLLTSLDVPSSQRAEEIVGWYVARWQIEVFHRVLKTGCKVESRQMREMSRLRPMIALDMVVAVHLMSMLCIARAEPQAAASRCLDPLQIKILCQCIPKKPIEIETLTMEIAVLRIACMGGFLSRKNDGKPGAEVLWRGIQKLNTLCQHAHLLKNI